MRKHLFGVVVGLVLLGPTAGSEAAEKPGSRMPRLPAVAELPGMTERSFDRFHNTGANLPAELTRAEAGAFPFSMVGSLEFRSGGALYSGSATLIKPTVALTAAHNLYDANGGFSEAVKFFRGQYDSTILRQSPAKAIYLYTDVYIDEAERNSSSSRAFAADVGWVTFRAAQAGRVSAPYTNSIGALRGAQYQIAVGYGLDFHNGRVPLGAVPTAGFRRIVGAYFENSTYGTEGGMSGGPVFSTLRNQLVLTGVVVSGTFDYRRSGIRIVDGGLVRRLRSVR